MKVAVRRINEWDGPSMLKIYSPYVGESVFPPDKELPSLSEYIQRIDRYTYGMGWILCEIDSVPAGFCHLTENPEDPENLFTFCPEIRLFVRPEDHRRGVGKALYSLMFKIMEHGNRRETVARIVLPNPQAIAFHKAMGFVPLQTEETVNSMGQKREILWMLKKLIPDDSLAERPTKPYLIENFDYETAREQAASLVLPPN